MRPDSDRRRTDREGKRDAVDDDDDEDVDEDVAGKQKSTRGSVREGSDNSSYPIRTGDVTIAAPEVEAEAVVAAVVPVPVPPSSNP